MPQKLIAVDVRGNHSSCGRRGAVPLLRASALRYRLPSLRIPEIPKVSALPIELSIGLGDLDDAPAARRPPARARNGRPNARDEALRRFEDFVLPDPADSPAESLQPLRLSANPAGNSRRACSDQNSSELRGRT